MCGLIMARGHKIPAVQNAMDAMSYRGKDSKQGLVIRGEWLLGHVRLAIQDLTDESAQPVRGGTYDLAYVGEIFNLRKAVRELSAVSSVFYRDGPKGFHAFDGFWAMASIKDDDYAMAFTDYLGQKPLYYWREQNIVCSELDPMFQLASRPEYDDVYFANVVKWGYDCTGRTPYKGISQIPPGHVLELFGDHDFLLNPYWDWNHPAFLAQPLGSLREELTAATLNRLVGDREVALLLSGGLDSSIIYYILKEAGRKVQSFSIENGESEFLPPGVKTLNIQPGLFDLRFALDAMQVPVDLGSLVPQYQLARALAEEDFNVCLSGDGADELFGGYRRAREYDSQASDIFMELPYYHLPRLDRIMMSQTVELRSPFLSPRVVALALRIPYEQRTSKQALKEAFKDLVPDNILNRAKHPLKTSAVINGGIGYRKHLIEGFKCL